MYGQMCSLTFVNIRLASSVAVQSHDSVRDDTVIMFDVGNVCMKLVQTQYGFLR